MHLHDGGLDPTSHIHVPAIIIQSHVASVILSDCDGHATAVSSQEPSVTGKDDWVSGSMSDGSGTQVTSCRPPPGLVGSQCLNESQMQWSAADTGAEACHARTPTKVDDVCPEDSISSPSSRRQATFESESLPEICAPVPTPKLASCLKRCQCQRVPWSWHAKLRGYKASPLAKRRTAKPATKAGVYLCRSPHG